MFFQKWTKGGSSMLYYILQEFSETSISLKYLPSSLETTVRDSPWLEEGILTNVSIPVSQNELLLYQDYKTFCFVRCLRSEFLWSLISQTQKDWFSKVNLCTAISDYGPSLTLASGPWWKQQQRNSSNIEFWVRSFSHPLKWADDGLALTIGHTSMLL